MKRQIFLLLATLCICMAASADKTVYIPSTWVYNSSTQEYTEGGNSDLQWSFNRSKQSDNCIVFWQKGFGTDPSTGSITFDVDAVLQVAENCYALNMNTLGFATSNMRDKYKLMILMNYTNDWVCYGGGCDFECSALWIGPSAVNPAGHSLAHEVGHSFHYMAYAEAANYNHTSSSTINTGFHLSCGNGQAIWEQTAQWQANQAYPAEMFNQSYPLFGNNVNYAFSHEWMRYQSYWFHYYLSDYYNDKTIVSQIWKQPMTGQSNGNATDFCQAYMALKNLTAAQFYERYFDYALHCATYDFNEAANYRSDYIGNFDYHCAKLADNQYQVAYRSAPQSTGFNVIELDVPTSGTTVTTALKALQHGCALDEKDPATYNNGEPNTNVKAGVSNYNSAGSASYRGFRMGYVFLKSDGTRQYYNDNTVHCTGTAETTESISTTVPANTSRMFLVVMPSLTTYVQHKWDETMSNDDQWPYSFTLTGTDLKTKSETVVYTEAIPEEPEFTKVIDGRDISDVTLTYNVILPVDASGYTGAGVTLNTGSAVNALCTAFQLESSAIFGHVIDYTASQGNNTIMSCALTSSGTIQANAKNTNGTFGHWFNASGTVADWGNNTVVFTQYDDQYASCTVGQMPGANSNGITRTVREGLIYKDSSGNTAKATIIYNVTFKTDATAIAYLTDIDYVEPSTASTSSATAYRATSVQTLSLSMMQGNSATSDAINAATLASALNNLTESYLTNSTYFSGYYDPLSSATTGNYVYYYALDKAPTATASSQGTVTYYQVASVTNDSELSGQYVHYYNASSGCISSATDAKLKVAYDMTNKTFTVKAADDCPVGTYTVYMAMARRYRSGYNNRIYVGYFPITVTVTENRETDEWPDITSLPDDYSKWFFIFKDHKKNLYLTMRDGVYQADANFVSNSMFYSAQDADKPENNKNSIWVMDYYEQDGTGYQLITSPEYRNFFFQTEWEAAQFFRTHDNGGRNNDWGRVKFEYNGTSWTVNNGTYPDRGYLGPWDEQFVDGAEVALNKTGANIGYFDVSAILRGEYVKTYENLTVVNFNNPLDITYCLENEGGERWFTIGWKNSGAAWQVQTNGALTGFSGGYFLESYNGNGLEATDFYQEIYGLPEGYYRFSAVANCSSNCYLYANAEQTAMPNDNPGTRTSVIVQVTGTEGYLKVGAKTGDNPGAWIAFDEAKLEYLGTSLPTAQVGNPTPSIPDGGYIQSLASLTFAFNEAASDSGTFSLLNPSATVTIEKNGTALAQGTLSLNGINLNVAFSGVTIEPNTTYNVTLPADVVGYEGLDANEEVTLTWHSPLVFDGTYYLYNTDEQKYLSRGGVWATSAIVDDYGLATILNTDISGITTLKFFDNQLYIFNDGFCYGDGQTGLQLTMEQATNGYKFLNRSNNRYMAIWGGRVVGDAAEGDNLVGTTNIWTLEPTADHVANYTRNADAQAATAAANVTALSGVTSQTALETAFDNGFIAVTVDEQYVGETGAEKYQVYAALSETLQEAEYEKYTVTDVKPGLYRLTVDAFQRAAWFDWVYDNDGARGLMYAYVNNAKTQLKSTTEYSSSTAFTQDWSRDGQHYINGIPEAYSVLDAGHYRNVVYVYVPADEGAETATITYGINNPVRQGNDVSNGTWCCYKNFKLERLIPKVTLDETDATAPTAMTDVALTFNRSIIAKTNGGSENAWNTICLPFSMDEALIKSTFGENTRVMEMTGVTVSGGNATFTFEQADFIEANKPYIMQTDQEGTVYTFTGIDITPSENLTVTADGVDFVGNYINQTVLANAGGTDYYILNDQFKSSTGRTKIKGFRAYFHVPTAIGVKALSLNIDGETTGIDAIDAESAVQLPADIYSVGGQLIRRNADSLDNLPAGVYIVNGKKFIKR